MHTRSLMVCFMPPSVSVPEKTPEHWSSQYVMYRYCAQAARPGKAVQIEPKTTGDRGGRGRRGGLASHAARNDERMELQQHDE
jgi:hypothetical protein